MRNRFSNSTALAAFLAGGCSGSPTAPPPVVNTPPAIESLVTASPRAEAARPVQVTAVVRDVESTLDRLTYTWSASPQIGTFSGTTSFTGNQATITWLPPSAQTSPDLYTITLTVTEAYTSGGQARQNSVSSTVTVRYNDSRAETSAIATLFIRDFGMSSVTPEQCVRNFSTTGICAAEREAELDEIRNNREDFQILGGVMVPQTFDFNDALTEGTVRGPCQFEDIPNPPHPNAGKREFVSGTCRLTTVYENFRWYLCASRFDPPYNTTLASLRNRVPGGIRN